VEGGWKGGEGKRGREREVADGGLSPDSRPSCRWNT